MRCNDCVHFDVCKKHDATVDFDVDDGVCLHFEENIKTSLKTARPDFEAMYCKAMDELSKEKRSNEILREGLACKEKQLAFYEGIKQTVEIVFKGEFYNA